MIDLFKVDRSQLYWYITNLFHILSLQLIFEGTRVDSYNNAYKLLSSSIRGSICRVFVLVGKFVHRIWLRISFRTTGDLDNTSLAYGAWHWETRQTPGRKDLTKRFSFSIEHRTLLLWGRSVSHSAPVPLVNPWCKIITIHIFAEHL